MTNIYAVRRFCKKNTKNNKINHTNFDPLWTKTSL